MIIRYIYRLNRCLTRQKTHTMLIRSLCINICYYQSDRCRRNGRGTEPGGWKVVVVVGQGTRLKSGTRLGKPVGNPSQGTHNGAVTPAGHERRVVNRKEMWANRSTLTAGCAAAARQQYKIVWQADYLESRAERERQRERERERDCSFDMPLMYYSPAVMTVWEWRQKPAVIGV